MCIPPHKLCHKSGRIVRALSRGLSWAGKHPSVVTSVISPTNVFPVIFATNSHHFRQLAMNLKDGAPEYPQRISLTNWVGNLDCQFLYIVLLSMFDEVDHNFQCPMRAESSMEHASPKSYTSIIFVSPPLVTRVPLFGNHHLVQSRDPGSLPGFLTWRYLRWMRRWMH